ncbi:MAG: hypothetical protein M0R74_08335 [Dehalococcoidia bacterium]|nr:hypothetical protein [Dehalococcoidia bacterium]
MAVKDPARAKARIEQQIARIAWLRGTGPNPFEYDQWNARTKEILSALFGPDSPELERYEEAANIRGRLPGVRGQAENMTLNIHGQWGILGRLERAKAVLQELANGLSATSQ